MKLGTHISMALLKPCFVAADSRYESSGRECQSFGWFARVLLLAMMVQVAGYAQNSNADDQVLIEMARKHIKGKIPKGMTALKDAEIALKSKKQVNEVDFTLELECDEPRYVVRDIEVGGEQVPGKIQKKLQLEGLSTQYLFKRDGKGDLKTIQGKFNIRSDGSPGTITAFLSDSVGITRGEQPDLPVDGDPKYLSAKASAESYLDDIKKANSEKATAAVSGFLNGIKTVATTVGSVAGAKSAEFKTNIVDTAIRAIDAATGQQAPAAQSTVPVAASAPAAAPSVPAAPQVVPQAPPAQTVQPAAPQVVPPQAVISAPAAEPSKSLAGAEVEWLTPEQAAKKLQISESDVLNAIAKGEIKAKKIGPVWRISAKELQ